MDPIMMALIAYITGTLLGLWWGFKGGVRTGADLTITSLIKSRYLKTIQKNGKTEIVPYDTKTP